MLQQTQVERVVAKYRQFIKRFPSPRALAAASPAELLRAWQGMGYNRRALLLKKLAGVLCAQHGGCVPATQEALDALPGIGAATASSIRAFAFNQPAVFIETNIRSVFLHHFFGDRTGITDEQLLPLVEKALDRKEPRRWYSALMDYGVALKKKFGNPNVRSLHYSRQARFAGSNRQLRGAIVRCLTAGKRMGIDELERFCGDFSRDRIVVALGELQREGLVRAAGGRYRL